MSDLIRVGVKKEGVRGLARSVKISPAIVSRYMNGKVGEPSQATLEKLSAYFGVTVAWLRGDAVDPTLIRMAAKGGEDPEELQKYCHVYGMPSDEELKEYNIDRVHEIYSKLSLAEQKDLIFLSECYLAFDRKERWLIINSITGYYHKVFGKYFSNRNSEEEENDLD